MPMGGVYSPPTPGYATASSGVALGKNWEGIAKDRKAINVRVANKNY